MLNELKAAPKWQQITIFGLILTASFAFMGWAKDAYQASQPPSTIAEAEKRMIGSWSFTEPVDTYVDTFPFQWEKWDIRPGGKVTVYRASPRDSGWGTGEIRDYETITDKYSDTGERWYGIRLKDTVIIGIYRDDKIILTHPAYSTTGAMLMDGKNPFSP